MLVSVEGMDVFGDVDFVDVDEETANAVKAVKDMEELCEVGSYDKEYTDHTGKVGKWSLGEYFAKKESTGGYGTYSLGSQIREKCDQCDVDTPCCEASCGVWEYKKMEMDSPCRSCKFDGECIGVMDTLEDYITEIKGRVVKEDSDLRIKYKGKKYTLGGVQRMEKSIDKYILYIKLMNEVYRIYGNSDLMFRVSKDSKYTIVKFQGDEYKFPSRMSKREVMVKVYHRVEYYMVDSDLKQAK